MFTQANDAVSKGREPDAVLLLEEALRFDPKFATAQTRLGDVLLSIRREREAFAAWKQAVALVDERQLTTRESQWIRAQYLEDTGDLPGAEKAYQTYLLHYPDDFRALVYLGTVLTDIGRADEGLEMFQRADRLRPALWTSPVHLAQALLASNRFDDAAQQIRRIGAAGQPDWETWLNAGMAFARGDAQEALRFAERLRQSSEPTWQSRGFKVRAAWLVDVGDDERALAELEEGIRFDAGRGLREREADKWLQRAAIECRRQHLGACADAAARGLAVSYSAVRAMRAGTLMARAGRLGEADGYLQSMETQPDIPTVRAARLRLTGEVQLARNRITDALATFRQAAALTRVRH